MEFSDMEFSDRILWYRIPWWNSILHICTLSLILELRLDGSHNYRLNSTCVVEYKLKADHHNSIFLVIDFPRMVLVTWNMAKTKVHLGCPNLVYFFCMIFSFWVITWWTDWQKALGLRKFWIHFRTTGLPCVCWEEGQWVPNSLKRSECNGLMCAIALASGLFGKVLSC